MVFRTRDEGSEFFQQLQRSQDQVRGSVAPGPFEAIRRRPSGSLGMRYELSFPRKYSMIPITDD